MLIQIIQGFPTLKLINVIDILLVAFLFYELYKLVKGTNAISILIGIISLYVAWKIVSALQMQLLSEIFGQFISIGVIALVIVFQPEIRRFLLLLGTKGFIDTKTKRFLFWRIRVQSTPNDSFDAIVQACLHMSSTKTGALIVMARKNELQEYINNGSVFSSDISAILLETIFFKNSPLHDGAVVIVDNHIKAARCILPVSSNASIADHMGLRHRSAIGITEQTDAIAIIVSEQTGAISYAVDGHVNYDVTPSDLKKFLEAEFVKA
ncbi:diadenylate cyclase CdaA [Bacteroidales bacterium OttesenSCG-928-C19]|nr:diadenylate cyclase CdaA [Bacteroidales bacterium OttesenSCG-928-C19]